MRPRFRRALVQPYWAALCFAALGFVAGLPAHAQTGGGPAAAAPAAPAAAHPDAEHEAAVLRLVQALDYYPIFKHLLGTRFGAPGQPDDPALQRFIEDTFPPSWLNDTMVKFYGNALTGVSRKDIDEAVRFFHSPAGGKYRQTVMQGAGGADASSVKWTPDEQAAIERFSIGPVGAAFSRAGAATTGVTAASWGEKEGRQRLTDLLIAAQAKYAGFSDAAFQAEAARLHDGSSSAGTIAQLALLKEYNERSQHRLMTVFESAGPILRRVGALQLKDMVSKEGITQTRKDLQAVDDLYTTGNEGLQMSGQFTMECAAKLSAPAGIKKIWSDSMAVQFKALSGSMSKLTSSIHDFTAALRALLDFNETHQATVGVDKDGNLSVINKADLDAFQALSARLENARSKLRDAAGAARGTQ